MFTNFEFQKNTIMKKLVAIFKSLTPYDHFMAFLIILSVLKIGNVFSDGGLEAGLHFLKLGGALFVISTVLFFGFKYAFDKKKKYQHALISTLLILLVLSHEDPDPVRGVAVILMVYVSKFFIKYKNRNIFNPIVFGIGVVTLASMMIPFIDTPPANWAGIDIRFTLFGMLVPIAIVPILLSLNFNVARIKRHPLALSFIISSLLLGFLIGQYHDQAVAITYVLSTTFVGVAILVEPKTSPSAKKEQMYFGVGMAFFITLLYFFEVPNAPILGLLGGNVFYLFRKMNTAQRLKLQLKSV